MRERERERERVRERERERVSERERERESARAQVTLHTLPLHLVISMLHTAPAPSDLYATHS